MINALTKDVVKLLKNLVSYIRPTEKSEFKIPVDSLQVAVDNIIITKFISQNVHALYNLHHFMFSLN
jgi:hypothetical protein